MILWIALNARGLGPNNWALTPNLFGAIAFTIIPTGLDKKPLKERRLSIQHVANSQGWRLRNGSGKPRFWKGITFMSLILQYEIPNGN